MTLVERNMVCDKFNSVKHKHGGFRHEGLQYRYELLLHIPYEAYFVEITISKWPQLCFSLIIYIQL
jgi:hypothetical protein